MPHVEVIDETSGYLGVVGLKAALSALMAEWGHAGHEVTVVLLEDEAMAQRNWQDRGVREPTDVLSYPTFEPGAVEFPRVTHLGDVLIATGVAARQAAQFGHSLEEEVLQLAAHGLAHLTGLDHDDEAAWLPFKRAQQRILELAAGAAPNVTASDAAGVRPPADLLAAAEHAYGNAYAPYSGFRVGAALRGESGAVYAGANVENASYGLSRCAEQSAVQSLASAGERHFNEIVIYSSSPEPATPCGACRQVLFEFAEDAQVYLVSSAGTVRVRRVSELLPYGFKL